MEYTKHTQGPLTVMRLPLKMILKLVRYRAPTAGSVNLLEQMTLCCCNLSTSPGKR